MRIFARREHPHPGAQLSLVEQADGWRYTLWVTNMAQDTPGWRGQNAYIDAAHRVTHGWRIASAPAKTPGSAFPVARSGSQYRLADRQPDGGTLLSWRLISASTASWPAPSPRRCATRVLHTAARLSAAGRRRRP